VAAVERKREMRLGGRGIRERRKGTPTSLSLFSPLTLPCPLPLAVATQASISRRFTKRIRLPSPHAFRFS